MAKRTPAEILAQRDAWMARKARRAAGEDVPLEDPFSSGEAAESAETSVEQSDPEVNQPEAASQSVSTPSQPDGAGAPQRSEAKRSQQEVLAQREAWMARKAAQAAGQAPPPSPAPAPQPKPAAPAASVPVAAAPKPKPAAAPAPKPAAAPKPKAAVEPASAPIAPNITRRELLNYAWLASIGLFTAETVGLSLWFAFPNFLQGQFGGQFPIGGASSVLPEVNAGPKPYTDGKFWLVNVDDEAPNGEPRQGVLALFKVCTHLGCLYQWIEVTVRFECPCHGSKFALTGDYLVGPARRSLDRFVIQAYRADGSLRAETTPLGEPLLIEADDQLVIDTGQRILGTADIIPA